MPNFLPPVVLEILGKADEALTTMDTVQASATKMAEKVISEAKRQASAQRAAADEAAAAADKAAKAAEDAAARHAAAVQARIDAEEKAAAATEASEGQVTAAVEKAQAAVAQAQADEAKAYQIAEDAAAKSADAQSAAMAKVQAASEAESAASTSASAKRQAVLAQAADAAGKAGAIGLGAVGVVAGASVEMATKFQASTTKLVTSAGESDASIGQVRDGILSLAGQVGVTANSLADDMYKVSSAGYHGAAGLGVLKAAEEGAKAEGADGAKVADALSSALRDYYPHATSAADVTKASTDVMSKFIGATSAGKMSFDDLAGSLNSILPVASAAKINLSDVMGVLASMTVHGISADQATQNMADAIRHLQAPTATMSKAMATLGIDSNDVAQKLGERGLSGTMQFLSDKVKAAMPPGTEKVILDLGNALSKSSPQVQELGQKLMDGTITMGEFTKAAKALDPISGGQAMQFETLAKSTHQIGNQMISGADVLATYGGTMAKVMGDATGLKVALMTTGENAQYTSDAVKSVSGSTADAAGNVRGWSDVQQNAAQNFAKLKATLESVAITLGNSLMPAVTAVTNVLQGFANWAQKNPQLLMAIVVAVSAVSAVLLVFAGVMAIVNIAMSPVSLIVLAIVAAIAILIAIIVVLYMNWDKVVKFLKDVWNGFVGWFQGIMNSFAGWWNGVWNGITGFARDAWNGFTGWFKGVMDSFLGWWRPIWAVVAAIAAEMWNVIVFAGKLAITVIGTVIIGPIVALLNILGAAFGWLYKNAIKPAWDAIVSVSTVAAKWIDDNVFKPLQTVITLAGMMFNWLWKNAIKPAWDGISKTMGDAWKWLVDNVFTPIHDALDFAADKFSWFWKNVIQPVWTGISKAIGDAWNWIVTYVMNSIHTEVDGLNTIFTWLWKNVIQPVWDGIQHAIGDAWTWISQNVFSPIHDALDGLGKAFDATGQWIGQAWDKIKGAVSAPVHFIVDNVYTNGIEKVWNDIASSVGLDLKLPDVKLGFAQGGIMPGYTPGTDNQLIAVSGGEAIMRPEWTRAVGAQNVHAMNAMARQGDTQGIQRILGLSGFADGGIAGFAGGGITDVIGSIASNIGDFLSNPAKAIGDMIKGPIDAMASMVGGGDFGKMAFALPGKVIDQLVKSAQGLVAKVAKPASGGGGGNVGAPGAVSGDLAGWIASAMSAAGVSGANWLNGLENIAMHESGGNPNAQNNWDSNAAMGDPSRGLMQTIGSTFESYRLQSLPDDIFNPIANAAAAIRYIESRYGDIANVPGLVSEANGGAYQGYASGGVVPTLYDNGGWLPQGLSVVRNESGRPEPVFTGAQFDAMRAGAGSRTQHITVNAVTNASATDIAREVGWALRNQN